jgi:hypothetical protein
MPRRIIIKRQRTEYFEANLEEFMRAFPQTRLLHESDQIEKFKSEWREGSSLFLAVGTRQDDQDCWVERDDRQVTYTAGDM